MRDLGITVYPTKDFDLKDCKRYIKKASDQCFTRVFLTFFCLPPKDIANERYLEKIKEISLYAKSLGMKVQADFFPEIFDAFNATPDNIKPIIDAGIEEIRIDGGFTFSEIALMTRQECCGKVIINASELEDITHLNKNFDEIIDVAMEEFFNSDGIIDKIEASHNMYPHEGTGLLMSLLVERAQLFAKYNIRVSAFCNSLTYKTTLFNSMDGSPTVEDHRNISAYASAHELFVSNVVDSVFVADGFIRDGELESLTSLVTEKNVCIRVYFYPTTTDEEKSHILDLIHENRQAGYCIRSTQCRDTIRLIPNNTVTRHIYDVTIDNQDYERYLGEAHILLKEFSSNKRINVVGYIEKEDRCLLQWIKNGQKFQFFEMK